MRRVDNGSKVGDAVHSQVGDGKGSALVFVGLEFISTRFLRKSFDVVGDAGKTEVFSLVDDGCYEAVVCICKTGKREARCDC